MRSAGGQMEHLVFAVAFDLVAAGAMVLFIFAVAVFLWSVLDSTP